MSIPTPPCTPHRQAYHRYNIAAVFLLGLAAALLMFELESAPPLWWDEGWTLAVARNWVEQGHYGQLLNGQPAPPGLSAAFPVVAPAALSFRLFGVGTWQGRLPFALLSLATLSLMYYLAMRLYGRAVALLTMTILLFTFGNLLLNPIVMGRQVLGEMPALFFLLAGYALLIGTVRRPLRLIPVMGLWSLAVLTKVQVLPFWTVSLLVPSLLAALEHRWRTLLLLGAGWAGAYGMAQLLTRLVDALLRNNTVRGGGIPDLYSVTALVPEVGVRVSVLVGTLVFGSLALLGLTYAVWRLAREPSGDRVSTGPKIVRVALLSLACGWLAWYALLSIGWLRYLFPVTFIGSTFLAAMLYDLFNRYKNSIRARRMAPGRRSLAALLLCLVILLAVLGNLKVLYDTYVRNADTSVQQVAQYLNAQTAPDALVETYESELFLYLDRPYHFPPDAITVPITRRSFMGQDAPLDYDPLGANPDYLVVRPSFLMSQVYQQALAGPAFRLAQRIGLYEIYQRQR